MAPRAVVIIPTIGRPGYLDVTLASLTTQVKNTGCDLLVVADGPSASASATAARFGARFIAHDHRRGLNAARNTAIEHSDAPLLCYVDDDVRVHTGWLAALLAADRDAGDDVAILTGPISAQLEGRRLRVCGREGPPITHQYYGDRDRDVDRAWGANLAVRRAAIERVGPFDPRLSGGGDEEELQRRISAAGLRIRYIAAAGLDHRRSPVDSRTAPLARSAWVRGREARAHDRARSQQPSLRNEFGLLLRCAAHGPLRLCANGPIMTAHAAGRSVAALQERFGTASPPLGPGEDDFLSGRSGFADGYVAHLLKAYDRLLDLHALPSRYRRRRVLARNRRRRVLALAIERTDVPSILTAALAELRRSQHELVVAQADAQPGVGKYEALNRLLAEHDLSDFDWLLVLDDDVKLPRRFLDTLLAAAEVGGLKLAQPAHRRYSHAAWGVTIRRPGSDWRATNFVEIGPVTAFSRTAASELLPFPHDAGMGWGLDNYWSAVARERGWPIGVVDAAPIEHTLRPVATGYGRAETIEQARNFLANRSYTRRNAIRTISTHKFGRL